MRSHTNYGGEPQWEHIRTVFLEKKNTVSNMVNDDMDDQDTASILLREQPVQQRCYSSILVERHC